MGCGQEPGVSARNHLEIRGSEAGIWKRVLLVPSQRAPHSSPWAAAPGSALGAQARGERGLALC